MTRAVVEAAPSRHILTYRQREARAARAVIEAALDTVAWAWLPRLSRWIDMLVLVEEGAD